MNARISPSLRKSLLDKSAERLLAQLSGTPAAVGVSRSSRTPRADERTIEALIAADLVVRSGDGALALTDAGRAHVARAVLARGGAEVDPFRGQHLAVARRVVTTAQGARDVIVNEAESPLGWLARRKGKDGRALIEPIQLQAGERLRADFTRAQLMPRTTANWTAAVADHARSGDGAAAMTDMVVAARQRVNRALATVGPEFAGLLLDICCFLKGLEDVERERGWPPRAAKVVLQLGLDRLARHYGLSSQARGRAHQSMRAWAAPEEVVTPDET
jgi:hypothetical protein